jgi:hypothetical protein
MQVLLSDNGITNGMLMECDICDVNLSENWLYPKWPLSNRENDGKHVWASHSQKNQSNVVWPH